LEEIQTGGSEFIREWSWIEETMTIFNSLPVNLDILDRNAPGNPQDHPFVRLSETGSKVLSLKNRQGKTPPVKPMMPADTEIFVDPKLQTIRVGDKVLQWGGTVAWECFITLWKSRPSPVDLKLRFEHQKASDIVSEVRKFLREKGLGQLADALKSSKNVGYYFDLPS
jgi:hypothetical protein